MGLEGRYGVGCRPTAGIVLSYECRLNDWEPVWDEGMDSR